MISALLVLLSWPGAAVAKTAAAPSVRVEVLTQCHALVGTPAVLRCATQIWVSDRWKGRFGSVALHLELDHIDKPQWSATTQLRVGAEPVTRSVRFEIPRGDAARLRSVGDDRVWTLWRAPSATEPCPASTASMAEILAQPLPTAVRAEGWAFGARSSRTTPGVDFSVLAPAPAMVQTALLRSDDAMLCQSDGHSLHVEPQNDDPYVQVMSPGVQILLALPLATIP